MKKLLFLSCLLRATASFAQQDPVHSLFSENALYFNPAYAGARNYGLLTLQGRNQWPETDRNPISYYISYDQHFDSINSGIGIVVAHDQLGLETTDHIGLNYSYKIPFGPGSLRFGTQVAAYRKTMDFSKFISTQPTGLPTTKQTQVKPDADLGIWYEVPQKIFMGLSTRHIPESRFDKLYYDMARHYYFTAGYRFSVTNYYQIMTSALVKTDAAAGVIDLNLRVYYNNFFNAGVTYRTFNANPIVVHASFHRERLKLSAAYDFGTTIFGDSFEAQVQYILFAKKPKSPAAKPPAKKSVKLTPPDED